MTVVVFAIVTFVMVMQMADPGKDQNREVEETLSERDRFTNFEEDDTFERPLIPIEDTFLWNYDQ